MKSISPEKLFVIIASIFGLLFLVLTPPFQAPDEHRHFFRAYQISEGTLIPTKINNRVGGFLPRKVHDCVIPYAKIRGNAELKMSSDTIWNSLYSSGSDEIIFIDFPASAVYSSVSYIPQAIGIAIAKPFGATPVLSLYIARLFTLICWIFAVFLAIRTTPIFKWLFVALALLPMSVFIHSSLSADMMTNAFAFLFIAFVLKSAFSGKQMSTKEFITLLSLIVVLASAKLLYAPLVLLFLLIPIKNFTGKKSFYLRFGLISLVALMTPFLWSIIQGNVYVNYADYNVDYREYVNLIACANLNDQLSFLMHQPGAIFEIFGNSIVNNFRNYSTGFIGNFGWYEVPLPGFVVAFAFAFLSLVTWADGNSTLRMARYQRVVLLTPFLIILILIILSQYLIWTCVGSNEATNLQGRYIIPILPLLLILFYQSKERFKRFLPGTVVLFSATMLIISSVVIYNRYYVPVEYEIETVICDHETVGQSEWKTSNPTYEARNSASQSSEYARSGKYSSKIDHTNPFGTLISFDNCKYGDILQVEAWKLGQNGIIIVSDEGGKNLYLTTEQKGNSPSNKWEKVTLEVKIPSSIVDGRISCYLCYPALTDSCYFDDVKAVLKRKVD
jgi:uncharacterized membrane protein